MRIRVVAAAVFGAFVLGGCDRGPVFTDEFAGRRVALTAAGPQLDVTYLSCDGEGSFDLRVVEQANGIELEWTIDTLYDSGAPGINGSHYYIAGRPQGPLPVPREDLPEERETTLELTITYEDGQSPIMVSNFQLSDLPQDGIMLANGHEVDNPRRFIPPDWESRNSDAERRLGCHLV